MKSHRKPHTWLYNWQLGTLNEFTRNEQVSIENQ